MRVAHSLPLLLLLGPTVLGGCATGREGGARKNPLASAQRVLAIDFAPSAIFRRTAGIVRTLDQLAREPARAARATLVPARLLHAAGNGLAAASARAGTLFTKEVQQVPAVPRGAAAHFGLEHTAQRLADNLADLPVLFGIAHQPFGELADRRHRTDPNDDRPEAGFVARLRRRLRL